MACQRASTGKAPGPDTIPNEIIKFLPEKAHDVIYSLFTIMAKHSYTPRKWCTSATKLIYKPNKTDPNNPTNYRPIALMNCILKIWTSILTNIGTQIAETEGIFSDTADGFRSHRNIYDSISTHITMYEDAKISKQNIYTAYSDFKGAFGGMDHRILFQIMKEYGFQDSYINTCKQLYDVSNTYYMTPHGNTSPISIQRGTLQGDTLSPFLFTIFMEPLLRWLAVGSRGYCPTYQPHKSTTAIITYDDHGYADDVSITAGTLHNLKIQLKKLHLFSEYTGLQLETTKCEATGALWALGNPLTQKKTKHPSSNKSTP
jgi:hypothetical protein